jgi:hypothetical protein
VLLQTCRGWKGTRTKGKLRRKERRTKVGAKGMKAGRTIEVGANDEVGGTMTVLSLAGAIPEYP